MDLGNSLSAEARGAGVRSLWVHRPPGSWPLRPPAGSHFPDGLLPTTRCHLYRGTRCHRPGSPPAALAAHAAASSWTAFSLDSSLELRNSQACCWLYKPRASQLSGLRGWLERGVGCLRFNWQHLLGSALAPLSSPTGATSLHGSLRDAFYGYFVGGLGITKHANCW